MMPTVKGHVDVLQSAISAGGADPIFPVPSPLEAWARDLEKTNARLEDLTRHLAQARDEAEQANQAKSRFLASMSHELRTPLNGVLGYAQLLRMEGGLDPIQTGRVDAMLGAGQHLLDMINRVLELAELEAPEVALEVGHVDPHEVAATCMSMLRYIAEAKRLPLHLRRGHDMPRRVFADAGRLRQVLLAIVGNAIKFTHDGSVELHLRAGDGGVLRIDVADTGPGLPAHVRRQFGEASARPGSAAGLIEGAGMGLALVVRLVHLMGGRLGYDERLGGGSVFWVEMPAVEDLAASVIVAVDPGEVRAPNGRLRLLVVDDIDINRDIASAFLSAGGHEVICAETGEAAIAALQEAAFDVVLMDVCMPGMDGLEATRRIRALPDRCRSVPIVALTAQAFAEQIRTCHVAGMNSHISKPFTYESLLDAVVRAADEGRLAA